jgi:hypothetical protein
MTETITTHIAAIGAVADVVTGEFCDVQVYEAEGTPGFDRNYERVIEYAPTGPLVFDAETTVRVDDPDSAQKVQGDAERILTENGWDVVSEWTVSDNAMYADVQKSA